MKNENSLSTIRARTRNGVAVLSLAMGFAFAFPVAAQTEEESPQPESARAVAEPAEPGAHAEAEKEDAVVKKEESKPVPVSAAPSSEAGQSGSSSAAADAKGCRKGCSYRKDKLGTVYFSGGVGFFDSDKLNNALSGNGYGEVDAPAIPLGFGFSGRRGRLLTGFDWYWVVNSDIDANDPGYSVDYKANYWLFRYGFDVVQWKGLSVYPLLSIGMGHMKLAISQETGASFEDVLSTPNRDSTLSQNSLLLDVSLGVEYRFLMSESERKTSWVTLGLRGGYMFQPYSGEWNTRGAEISGGPSDGFQGPVVQMLIGFSGKRKPIAVK